MTSAWFAVWMIAALMTPLSQRTATQLRYRGTLTPAGRKSDGNPAKRFTVNYLHVPEKSGGSELAFLVDEEGGGGWTWPERYGVIELNRTWKPTNKSRARLLHTFNGIQYSLSLEQVLFQHAEKIKPAAKWKTDNRSYEVVRRQKKNGRDCWRIETMARFGREKVIWVDAASRLVVGMEQILFMGRGDRFRLQMDLALEKPIDEKQLARIRRPLNTLMNLRTALKRSETETKPELGDAQLKLSVAALKKLGKSAEGTPFRQLVAAIHQDVGSQLKRSSSVDSLAKKFLGKPAPKFQLLGLNGKSVDPKSFAGKILVLHFWSYQGKPLIEPYGQVGYLDFLNGKRRKLGVKVFGVAVDKRLANSSSRAAVIRSVRQLKSFMNLGYDVTYDSGGLLRKFGDPRRTGAKLPLWIIIDPQGKVALYHVGFYQIRPNEGLRVLDDKLIELIRRERGRDKSN